MSQFKVSVELSTISAFQGIQIASVAIVALAIASRILFAPRKLGKALPTPGGEHISSKE